MSVPHRPPQIDVPATDSERTRAPRVGAPDAPIEDDAAPRAGRWAWMTRWLPFVHHDEQPAPATEGQRPPIADAAGRTP